MKKIAFYSILVSACLLVCAQAIHQNATTPIATPIQIEINGNEGDKIYAEFNTESGARIIRDTLPVSISFEEPSVRFEIALENYTEDEPFQVKIQKGNDEDIVNTGKGVKGRLTFKETKYNFPFFNNRTKVSNVTINHLSEKEIRSFLKSISSNGSL